MSNTLLIPTNKTIRGPIQNYVQKVDGLLGLELLPFDDSFAQVIETEEQDHEEGMTAAHVLGKDPVIDTREGSKKFKYEPLHFKETDVLTEKEILKARQLGTFGQPTDLSTEVAKIAKRRANKTLIRVEWSIWQAFGGRLQYNENGVKVDETFNVQTHNVVNDWDSFADSTPMTDLDIALDKFDGTGASREGARIVANRQTWRLAMQNMNDADLKALDRSQWSDFRFMFSRLSEIFADKTDGAVIKSYDKGYYQNGTFEKFLKFGEVRIIGKRDFGEDVGNWIRTPSTHIQKNGKDQPGYFVIVEVNGNPSNGSYSGIGGSKNPKVEVTGGIYGGPNLDFDDNVIKMQVA